MKQIICIGSREAGSKNDIRALAKGLLAEGLQAEPSLCYWEDLVFVLKQNELCITDTVSGRDVSAADLVMAFNWYKTGDRGFYRDMALTVARYLEDKGVAFWNTEMGQQRSTTKLSALLLLSLRGLPIPATIFSLNRDVLPTHAAELGMPLIVKTIAGSRGAQNFLVKSSDELRKVLAANATTPYMLEEYIPNDHDLRIICYAGEPTMVIRRSRTSDATHLNNTSQGATAELLDIHQVGGEILQVCREACKLLGREMAGVDILLANDGTKRMVCLEVNPIPQLTSGSYVSEKSAYLAAALNNYLKGTV